jgi:hypothetical protein
MLRGPLSRLSTSIPDRGTGASMIRPAGDARRYQIISRGECGKLLISVIDNLQVNGSAGALLVVASDR